MSVGLAIRFACVALAVAVGAPSAFAYIHFPPMTLDKMCKTSTQIRLLTVKKHNKEKGVIIFEATESLKGPKAKITSFKHVIGTDAAGVRPILDWVADGKQAVMFSIEGEPRGTPLGCGYVFIDKFCYTVDYSSTGEYWLFVRAEPDLSACYYGTVEQLQKAVKDILDGKEVKVPVKEPERKEDRDKRMQEVNDVLNKNRKQ
jgi:hypothetical protein